MNAVLSQFEQLQLQDNDTIVLQCHIRHGLRIPMPIEQLLQLVRETKSVIAGSFILDCLLGTTFAGDIDVFTPYSTADVWDRYLNLRRFTPGRPYGDTHFICHTYRIAQLNLIFCSDVNKCIESFDLSLCKASYNGYHFANHEQVASRHMRIEYPFQDESMMQRRLLRILKYHERGFTITNTVLLANWAYSNCGLGDYRAFMLLMSRVLLRPDMFIP